MSLKNAFSTGPLALLTFATFFASCSENSSGPADFAPPTSFESSPASSSESPESSAELSQSSSSEAALSANSSSANPHSAQSSSATPVYLAGVYDKKAY